MTTDRLTPSPTPVNSSSSSDRLESSHIEALFTELDQYQTGRITKATIFDTLLCVYKELAPSPKLYHLNHPSRVDDLNLFIESLFPDSDSDDDNDETQAKGYNLQQFTNLVRGWNLPSLDSNSTVSSDPKSYSDVVPATHGSVGYFIQRLRSRCSTNGHRYLFILIVILIQLGSALGQFSIFYNDMSARRAFGPGMVVAKTMAGALYPTLALMLLSMSRWLQNFLRRSKYLRRFIDWEYARAFHIKMACLSFLLGIIHAISHLTGTYRHALRHPEALAIQIWKRPGTPVPHNYLDFLVWRASWTGWSALAIFTVISLCASPVVRRRSFELFQFSHLLMYPLFFMLLFHGSSAILKKPQLGWWLLLPISLIAVEKIHRIVRGFIPLYCSVLLSEDDMVALSIRVGSKAGLHYRPGQYIYLLVPSISHVQWHPYTVSTIYGDCITLHIRANAGNWTRELAMKASINRQFTVAIDGPYGSVLREFYRYDKTIIFGAGIGITPFSAILFDLCGKLNDNQSPWKKDVKSIRRLMQKEKQQITPSSLEMGTRHNHSLNDDNNVQVPETSAHGSSTHSYASSWITSSRRESTVSSEAPTFKTEEKLHSSLHMRDMLQRRSISLYWTVRNCSDLQWLSRLLNELTPELSVPIKVYLYVTSPNKGEKKSMTIFRSLLDHRRISSIQQKTSFLTGLPQTCQFSRPNFEQILDDHYRNRTSSKRKVGKRARGGEYKTTTMAAAAAESIEVSSNNKTGVIFCGPAALGNILSEKCKQLTNQARQDSSQIRYQYHSESF